MNIYTVSFFRHRYIERGTEIVTWNVECPNHSWIAFIGTPLARSKLAQEYLKS